MTMAAPAVTKADQQPSRAAPYILPFATFLVFLAARDLLQPLGRAQYILAPSAVTLVLLLVSRPVLSFRVVQFWRSCLLGAAVFLIWIAPDVLFPSYRQHWLFQNPLTGAAAVSIPLQDLSDPVVLTLRSLRATVLVPIIEELFWRAFLLRWLIARDFGSLPLGASSPFAFWTTAILFAAEHGPYWEVGLIAGILYNWWMIRTRSLGDCILAHAVTNGLLCWYVIQSGHWEYWL